MLEAKLLLRARMVHPIRILQVVGEEAEEVVMQELEEIIRKEVVVVKVVAAVEEVVVIQEVVAIQEVVVIQEVVEMVVVVVVLELGEISEAVVVVGPMFLLAGLQILLLLLLAILVQMSLVRMLLEIWLVPHIMLRITLLVAGDVADWIMLSMIELLVHGVPLPSVLYVISTLVMRTMTVGPVRGMKVHRRGLRPSGLGPRE
jgi:hypothetical protein